MFDLYLVCNNRDRNQFTDNDGDVIRKVTSLTELCLSSLLLLFIICRQSNYNQRTSPYSMATLTRLTYLTVILIINLRYCSFEQTTINNGLSSLNNSRIPEEMEEQKHDNQNDNGKPKLNSSVGRGLCKTNCLPNKDPLEAAVGSNSIPSTHLNSSTPRANQRITVVSTEPNNSSTQENGSAVHTENQQINISLHLHVQPIDASNTNVKEFISTDYSNQSNFSRSQDVHYGNPEKTFVRENGTEVSKLQTYIKSIISKRSLKKTEPKEGITQEERAKVLKAHNKMRRELKESASNMIFMVSTNTVKSLSQCPYHECEFSMVIYKVGAIKN